MLVARLRLGRRRLDLPARPGSGLAPASSSRSLFSLVHGFAAITWRGNQIVSGVAINMLAAGLTAILGNAWYGQGGRTPPLEGAARFRPIDLALRRRACADVPVLGLIYAEVISGHTLLVYLAFLCVPLTAWWSKRTRFGLRLRAVGENPAAVDTAGISVAGLRYGAVLICGVLCGLGGTYLVVAQSAGFLPHMTAGKGFIALAAADLRQLAALAGARRLPAVRPARRHRDPAPGRERCRASAQVPVQAIQALPYLMTVILLAGFIGKATPPKASGLPYVKER